MTDWKCPKDSYVPTEPLCNPARQVAWDKSVAVMEKAIKEKLCRCVEQGRERFCILVLNTGRRSAFVLEDEKKKDKEEVNKYGA